MTDINKEAEYIIGAIASVITDDDLWKNYGYKKRPKRGLIFSKFFKKQTELENHIVKVVIAMSFIDLIKALNKSKLDKTEKLALLMLVTDRVNAVTKQILPTDEIVQFTIEKYEECEKNNTKEICLPFTREKSLSKNNFAKFMAGTISMFSTQKLDYFLMDSEQLVKRYNKIDKLSEEYKLKDLKNEEYTKTWDKIIG